MTKPNRGMFQKGNKVGLGNPGPSRVKPITQAIISKLNEVDRNTGKEHIYSLVDELFNQALGYVRSGKLKGRKAEKLAGDIAAIREIIRYSDGLPVQGIALGAGEGTRITLVLEGDDEKLL